MQKSPSPSNLSFYDSDYSSYPIYQSFISSTPVSSIQNVQSKHSQPLSSSIYSARKRISDEAIERLNIFYAKNKRPLDVEKDCLARECNITVAQVNTWFNNARSHRGDTHTKLTQKLYRTK